MALLKARLQKEKKTKSPLLLYDTIKNFIDHVCPLFEDTVNEVSDLFAESDSAVLVNDKLYKESFGEVLSKISKAWGLNSKFSAEKNLEIFGLNLYAEDIKSVVYRIQSLGLKGGHNKSSLVMDISLILEDSYPILKLKVNDQKAIQHIFDYEQNIEITVINQLQKQLLRNITAEIKLMV